jgi:hypothetical protein
MNGTVRLESEAGRTIVTLDVPSSEEVDSEPPFSRENGSDPSVER